MKGVSNWGQTILWSEENRHWKVKLGTPCSIAAFNFEYVLLWKWISGRKSDSSFCFSADSRFIFMKISIHFSVLDFWGSILSSLNSFQRGPAGFFRVLEKFLSIKTWTLTNFLLVSVRRIQFQDFQLKKSTHRRAKSQSNCTE